MPNNGYFNIKRDNELIAAGIHFWCEGCLVARPRDDQSSDPRYCRGCRDLLLVEASMLTGHIRKPDWIPTDDGQPLSVTNSMGGEVLATIDAYRAKTLAPVNKGGRPKIGLPIDSIKRWQGQGLGATEIKRRLADQDTPVSMRTLYRILSGVIEG